MFLLLRIHPRIHNQWGKTGMCPLALDFLKHLCAKKPFVIANHLLIVANHLLIVGVCGWHRRYRMWWRISLKLETGWARSDGTWRDKGTHCLQSASGPFGQLISTLRLARLVKFTERRVARYAYHISLAKELAQWGATSLHLFQFDMLKKVTFKIGNLYGVIPTKVGMQCFSLDANWILVSTPTRTSWHLDFCSGWDYLTNAATKVLVIAVWFSVPHYTHSSGLSASYSTLRRLRWAPQFLCGRFVRVSKAFPCFSLTP